MHEKWDEPVYCPKNVNCHPEMSTWMIKVIMCQTGAITKPWANKEVWDYTIIDWFSDGFEHLLTSSPSLPCCGAAPLLFYKWSAEYADLLVLRQLMSEWGLTQSVFGPLFPPQPLDWRAFCWQLLALLPGQRHLSWAAVDHLFAPSVQTGHHLITAAMWHERRHFACARMG